MAPSDAELACLAGPLRILTGDQLKDAGLSRKQVRTRVGQGRLQRLWSNVYLVGPAAAGPLSLAHGAGLLSPGHAFVSHWWANHVHGFGPQPALPVDLLVVDGKLRSRPGLIYVHRSDTLVNGDLGHCGDIAVTSAARAILDTGDYATASQLETLIADALLAKKCTRGELEDVLDRGGRRKATARLRLALEDSPGITRSKAERMLRRLLREAKIEQPVTDHPIGPYFADFAWPKLKFGIEFDSYAHHSGKPAFHRDRERLAYLASKGWGILPVTWEHMTDQPLATVARIAAAIAVRG